LRSAASSAAPRVSAIASMPIDWLDPSVCASAIDAFHPAFLRFGKDPEPATLQIELSRHMV
jgi:hypothetical protein